MWCNLQSPEEGVSQGYIHFVFINEHLQIFVSHSWWHICPTGIAATLILIRCKIVSARFTMAILSFKEKRLYFEFNKCFLSLIFYFSKFWCQVFSKDYIFILLNIFSLRLIFQVSQDWHSLCHYSLCSSFFLSFDTFGGFDTCTILFIVTFRQGIVFKLTIYILSK